MLRSPMLAVVAVDLALTNWIPYRYYWFNYATHATTTETPAELPVDMVSELQFDSGSYYTNSVTKEASWADPAESEWRKMADPDGNSFWFNPNVRGPLLL